MASTTPTIWSALGKTNSTDSANGANDQFRSTVIGLVDGGFVVAWEDNTDTFSQQLGPNDIVGQRYDVLGNKVGGELHLSWLYRDFNQQAVALAAAGTGGFFAAYQSQDAAGFNDGENIDVAVFDAAGAPTRDDDFRQGANPPLLIDDTVPAIAGLSGGGYVLVYQATTGGNADVVGYFVDAGGTKGPQFTIANTGDDEQAPQVAVLSGAANDAFAAVYENAQQGTVHFAIRDTAGPVAADSVGSGASADVASLTGGGFAVTWVDPNGDGAGAGIKAVIVTNAGQKDTPFNVNTSTAGSQSDPSIAALSDGGFAVVWEDGPSTIRGQAFGANGSKVGSEFSFAVAAAAVKDSALTLLGDGRLVVSFTVDTNGNEDIHTTIWDPRLGDILGTAGADILTSHAGGGTVRGLAGDDRLYGVKGADRLDGGTGTNIVTGGAGRDNFVASRSSTAPSATTVTDFGPDKVDLRSLNIGSLATWQALTADVAGSATTTTLLNGFVSTLKLTGVTEASMTAARFTFASAVAQTIVGTAGVDHLFGAGGNGRLFGLAGNDRLYGENDNDTLTGGLGTDALFGGLGNDTYVLENGTDVVRDIGGGADRVTSTITRSLLAAGLTTIENLTLLGVGAANGTGNNLANIIVGNARANLLAGGLGNDNLNGGLGNDSLDGGVGNDLLNGSTGSDTLTGSIGIDRLGGGASNDFFVLNAPLNPANRDVIADFTNVAGNNDTFRLQNAVMPGVGRPGALNPNLFFAGAAAHDATDRIVYNKISGALMYDSNGIAAGGVTLLATLTNKPTLGAGDFVVI